MKNMEPVLTAGAKDTGGRVPLKWVSPAGERIPSPKKTTFPLLSGFTAGGKYYLRLRQLIPSGQSTQLQQDVYGREILCLKERFPCFDSYDFLHENRYYRWYFLREGGRLTMVYYRDEGKTVEVTEDVDRISHWQWEELRKFWNLE